MITEIDFLRRQNGIFRQALQDVVNPLQYLQREADKGGRKLSGAAYMIANDLHFVQGIAKNALVTVKSDIMLLGEDDFETCIKCGIRLEPLMSNTDPAELKVFYTDEDGAVHAGSCHEHGLTYFQFIAKESVKEGTSHE